MDPANERTQEPGTSRRAFLAAMGVLAGAGMLGACRAGTSGESGPSAAGSTPSAIPPIEQEDGLLRLYEWAGYELKWFWRSYAAQGNPDPKFSFFTSSENAIAKTAGGFEWDMAHPEIFYIQDFIDLGAIQPWDTSLISNFPHLNPALQEAGRVGDEQYMIVLDWGYSGVLIRSDHVDPAINSYTYLFDDELAGHISWFDTPWILMQAGLVLGVESDLFDMSADDLRACTDFCIDKTKNLHSIWVDPGQMQDDVAHGDIWAAYAWQTAYMNLKDDVSVQYIRPKEGVMSWAEGLVLNAGTENYHHAHAYADAWADVAVGQRLISSWGFGHSNLDVDISTIDPEIVEAFGLDDAVASLSEPQSILGRYQPRRAEYNRAWDEVKASAG